MGMRLFSSKLAQRDRAVYRGLVGFFLLLLLAVVWPVAKWFSRIEPVVLGLPFFLFYLTALLLTSFLVLLGVYLWEGRTGASSDPEESAENRS